MSGDFEIPEEVYQACEDGMLLFFCGAGVSKAAGYPLFWELASSIRASLHGKESRQESEAYKNKQFDQYFNLVEQRVTEKTLRPLVRKLLTAKPGDLSRHRALLELSMNRNVGIEMPRLITTNFDTLFEACAQDLGWKVNVNSAPNIAPQQSDGWNSIVYLHGRLNPESPYNNKSLVLTSADFGRAYLTERWASQFVTNLFKQFDVLFVGYSADDPLITYLLSALATQKANERRMYALIDRSEDYGSKWETMRVQPIPYISSDAEHSELTNKLTTWAEDHRLGIKGKQYRLRKIIDCGIGSLTQENKRILTWIMSDASGAPLQSLTDKLSKDIDTENNATHIGSSLKVENATESPKINNINDSQNSGLAPASWIGVFAQLTLLNGGRVFAESYVPGDRATEIERVAYSPFFGSADTIAPSIQLGRRALGVVSWLSLLAVDTERRPDGWTNSDELLNWVMASGGGLHPYLRFRIIWQIEHTPVMNPEYRNAWHLILNPTINVALQEANGGFQLYETVDSSAQQSRTSEASRSVLYALDPFLDFRSIYLEKTVRALAELRTSRNADDSRPRLYEYFFPKLIIRYYEQATEIWNDLNKQADFLSVLARDMDYRLRRALDLMHSVPPANDRSWHEDFECRQSENGTHDISYKSWPILIDLLWIGTQQLDGSDAIQARILYLGWVTSEHLTLNRLAIRAAIKWKNLLIEDRTDAILTEKRYRLTTKYLDDAIFELIIKHGSKFDHTTRSKLFAGLQQDIKNGPRRSDDERRHSLRVLVRIIAFERARFDIPTDLKNLSKKLKKDFPHWRDDVKRTVRHSSVFESRNEDSEKSPPDYVSKLGLMEPAEIASDLLKPRSFLGGMDRDLNNYLEMLANAGDPKLMSVLLIAAQRLGNTLEDKSTRPDVERFPHRAARLLLITAPKQGIESRTRFLETFDAVLPFALAVSPPVISTSNNLGDAIAYHHAINENAGILTQALFEHFLRGEIKVGPGLDEQFKSRLLTLVAREEAAATHARVIISSRLSFLWWADEKWSSKVLVNLLSWQRNGDVLECWQGFLMRPSVSDSLFSSIKKDFIKAFEQIDRLGELRKALVGLLLVATLDGDQALSDDEARDLVSQLSSADLGHVAWLLWRRTADTKDLSAEFFRTGVSTWLSKYWPRDMQKKSPEITDSLVRIALASGDALSEAIDLLVGNNLLGKTRVSGVLLYSIRLHVEKTNSPLPWDQLLRLLQHLLPTYGELRSDASLVHSIYGLRVILNRARQDKSILTNNSAYIDLDERARLSGQ